VIQKFPNVLIIAIVLAAAGCGGPRFPKTITFDRQILTKATSWTRGGISGTVYVPANETLPGASLQVGVIISSEHSSGGELHDWVREQFEHSGSHRLFMSDGREESCHAGVDQGRTYMALQVCKTGVERAACVEADEVLDEAAATSCTGRVGCFDDVCDRRWGMRREALDLLTADVLTIR
jgi:hypothetical protein